MAPLLDGQGSDVELSQAAPDLLAVQRHRREDRPGTGQPRGARPRSAEVGDPLAEGREAGRPGTEADEAGPDHGDVGFGEVHDAWDVGGGQGCHLLRLACQDRHCSCRQHHRLARRVRPGGAPGPERELDELTALGDPRAGPRARLEAPRGDLQCRRALHAGSRGTRGEVEGRG
jgi:hypothetical protein